MRCLDDLCALGPPESWPYRNIHHKKGSHKPTPKILEKRALDLFDAIKIWEDLKINVFAKHIHSLSSLKDKCCSVIFFNHGNSCLMTDYAFLLEDLASHGYVVVTITHQLKNDKNIVKSNTNLRCEKTNVIKNCLFTFDWLQKNNEKLFHNSLNLKKIGVIGHSMGAHASMKWVESVGYNNDIPETLFIHEDKKDVEECIITLDARAKKYSFHSHIPILMLMGEETKNEQIQNYDEKRKIGHNFIYYKNAHHGSFIDHAYINFASPTMPNNKWFDGTTIEFFNKVRNDVRLFLKNTLEDSKKPSLPLSISNINFNHLIKLANNGDLSVQLLLIHLYNEGIGNNPNQKEAER